jgi:hypothetical protein
MSPRVDEMNEASTRPDSAQIDTNERVAPFAALLAREEFLNELDRFSCSEWHGGTRQKVRVQALKWHTHRGTCATAVKIETGWHSVIGTVCKTDRSATVRAMETLRQAGFSPEAEFSIPRPLGYPSALGVRLEEQVQGPSAKEIFVTSSPQARGAASERCGRWLAHFHAAAPRPGTVADLSLDRARYQRWTDQVASLGEPLARKPRLLFPKLQAAAPAPGTGAYSAGHGRYIPEHVIFGDRRPTAIDRDADDGADPRRDIAWFVISLRRLALKPLGSLHALDGAAKQFPRTSPRRVARTAWPTFAITGPWSVCTAQGVTLSSTLLPLVTGPRSCSMKDSARSDGPRPLLRRRTGEPGEFSDVVGRRGGSGGHVGGGVGVSSPAGRYPPAPAGATPRADPPPAGGRGAWNVAWPRSTSAAVDRTRRIERGPLTAAVSATGTRNAVTPQVGFQVSGQVRQLLAAFNAVVAKASSSRVSIRKASKPPCPGPDVDKAVAAVLNQEAGLAVPSKRHPECLPAWRTPEPGLSTARLRASGWGFDVVTVSRELGCALSSRRRARLARSTLLPLRQDGESSRRARWDLRR